MLESMKLLARPVSESWVWQPLGGMEYPPGQAIWPDHFYPVARVESVSLPEIFGSCQHDDPELDRYKPPLHWIDSNARSMSVGDVAVVHYWDAWRVEAVGWTLVETNSSRRYTP